MEQLLEPLRHQLAQERLLEADWPKLVEGLAALGRSKGTSDAKTIEDFYGEVMSQNLIDRLVASEHRRLKIAKVARSFKIDSIVINFLKGNMFFMTVSRFIKKRAGTTWKGLPIPTAAMCYDVEADDFVMVFNAEFFASFIVDFGVEEGTKIIEGIYHHELYHFTLKHLTIRRRSPSFGWNVGSDAAINSLILASGGTLPAQGIIPSRMWTPPEAKVDLRHGSSARTLTPEEQEMQKGLFQLVYSWKTMLTSDWYFNDLMRWARENGHKVGDGGIAPKGQKTMMEKVFESMDMHDFWDSVPEEKREQMQEKMKSILRNAVRRADNESSGWGNIPADLRKDLRSYVDNRVDWDKALATFCGSFQRGDRKTTFKRINRRAPYLHPGSKRTHHPRIAVLIDQSGSVDDSQITVVFGVLGALAKKITFTVVPFDTSVAESDVFEWRKGSSPPLTRVRSGGTDFTAACAWINDPVRAGKFDGYMVITDGECSDPGHSRLRRAWVITPSHKLLFSTKELVINMDDRTAAREDAIR